MIKWFKRDFNSVRGAIYLLCNREIPVGIAILYYILMLPIGLLLMPFAKIWSIFYLRKINKELEEDEFFNYL